MAEPPLLTIDPTLGIRDFKRLVFLHGPKCAAWLVKSQRSSIHENGLFRVVLPRMIADPDNHQRTLRVFPGPPWYRVAVEQLRRLKLRWLVRELSFRDRVVHEFVWLRWLPR